MVDLSQDDRDIIKRYPLNDSLDKVGDLLQEAEKVYNSRLMFYDGAFDSLDHLYRSATTKLVYALQGTDAALNLSSQINDQKADSDLANLYTHLRKEKGGFSYNPYRALVRLVIQKAPDVDIWKAVHQVIETVSQLTPPATVPPTSDGTPWRSTSSSQRGNEQTRKLVEERLFDEIKTCTHKDVGGFDAKYFRNTSWEEKFIDIYKKIQERDDTGLSDFPNPPIQNDVLDWWFRLQNTFLTETRGMYFSTEGKKSLKVSEAERQVDVLMKVRAGDDPVPRHSWKDIRVVGELKQSNYNKKGTILQMERYVRDVFAAQPTRPFVHSFTLCGTEMEMWVTDRSGPYSSGSFDIRNEPERFFRAIIGYTLMSDEELGLDTFTMLHDDGTRTVYVGDIDTGEKKLLRLESMPISIQLAVVCRGTCCYLTKDDDAFKSQNAVKFSWTSARRQPEVELLQIAHQREVEGVARVIGYRSITSIAELREGLDFKKVYQFRSMAPSTSSSFTQSQPQLQLSQSFTELQGLSIAKGSSSGSSKKRKQSTQSAAKPLKLSRSSNLRLDSAAEGNEVAFSVEETQKASLYATDGEEPFENRVLRCLAISPAGRAIYKFDSLKELLLALRDAIKAHRSLYIKGKILHRDISENNIIITDPKINNGYSGMLIDLDLAKELGSGPTGARHQTGTMEFMAIEVLLIIDHTYRHDLESFFYVLIWQCAHNGWERYGRSKEKPKKSRLKKWYTGSYEEIADVKTGHMDANRFEDLLQEFPPECDKAKSLCRELRGILFPYCNGLVIGTPAKPEKLYDPVTQAFDKAIECL
ncbi:serine/threonine protein kinase Sgk2 [Histoplasma ohiense]|nr:serine/threonine protein kinase Sgk2 [Histoplasma ohiense (nom. inval.)]